MRKSGRQEKKFSEQVPSCFLAFLMNPSGPLRLWCASTANQTNELKSVHHAN